MAETTENRPAFDPKIQSENIAFEPDKMVACGSCARLNPPNRFKCLYCAGELEVKGIEDAAKLTLRKLELWERGYNLIVREVDANTDHARIAQLLSMETADVDAILASASPLPLARVESQKEVEVLDERLMSMGVNCRVIADDDLAADKPPVRLNMIEFRDDGLGLRDFNTGHVTNIKHDGVALIVPGLLSATRVDSIENKRSGKSKILNESSTASDDRVVDLYTREDKIGFRIHLAGFDFSCLGDEKGLLAVENMRMLVIRLCELAPSVKLIDTYATQRHLLTNIWEIESRNDPKGLLRTGFGKREFGNVASTNNLNQFTKYSRLQWHLL